MLTQQGTHKPTTTTTQHSTHHQQRRSKDHRRESNRTHRDPHLRYHAAVSIRVDDYSTLSAHQATDLILWRRRGYINQPTKKPPSRVASLSHRSSRLINSRNWRERWLEQRMFYLASTYFLRGLPPKYRRRCIVSQPSSRWIGVVPMRHGHQDRKLVCQAF